MYYPVLSNAAAVTNILPYFMAMPVYTPMQFIQTVTDSSALDSLSADSLAGDYNLITDPFNRFNYKDPVTRVKNKDVPDSLRVAYTLDSTGRKVRIEEEIERYKLDNPFEMTLDEYLEYRKKELETELWDSIMTRYDLREAFSRRDLARMLSQATGLSIPIPPNPVMSIFGKPEISINVHGEVNLRMGWRWDSQNLGTVSQFGQTQSTPIFDMDVRVNVSGRIGDKLKLGTDWNTRRQFEHENKFKIGYEGEDDDIIKLLQVGNVSLPIPSTLIGGGETLFGVRGDFQFGPLFLKTLVSQRRGERKFINVTGGVSKQPFSFRAYDYAKNHFFVDTLYKEIYAKYYEKSTPILPSNFVLSNNQNSNELRIKEIQVWESNNDVRNRDARNAVAIADLPPIDRNNGDRYDDTYRQASLKAGEVEEGIFTLLDSTRYKVDRNLGTVAILNLRPDRHYAVSYRMEGKSSTTQDDDMYCGELSHLEKQVDKLVLKLIYRQNMQPSFETLWARQMKNIYSINATGVNTTDTKISVWYINQNNDSTDVLNGAPDKLVTIMGVDRVNNSTGAATPDGQFDLSNTYFNAERGEITFPSLEPFREGLRNYFEKQGTPQLAEQYVYNEVYDTTYDVARSNTSRNRFIVCGEVSGKATNRISLGAFNLAPGSVRVTLDGVPLREYEDYVVDYYSGQLTLKNMRATLPNANLKIEYEQHDVFNISTRTLVGLRGDYILHRSRRMNAILGFTGMMYDQSAIQDRVMLGDEPVSNTMVGFDAKLTWDTPWLTKLIDKLPFYDTKTKSSINLSGEWAAILPEPNKRTSEIDEDNGEPVVYIDDFEGAQRHISLGLSPSQWTHSSQPEDGTIAGDAQEIARYRGQMYWYQKFIPWIEITEVYPNKSTQQGHRKLSPFQITFNPEERGIYNMNSDFLDVRNPQFDSTLDQQFYDINKPKIWGGMMRLFSAFNTNFDTENIEYIEVMMKIDQIDHDARMFIDIGQISEDVIPDGFLSTEDGFTDASPFPNNMIDEGEDVGIDSMSNAEEKKQYPYPLSEEKDPARDDYYFDFQTNPPRDESAFIFYNNYEGNSKLSELGQFPDTEILNKNNGQTLNNLNSYFTYEVNLDANPARNTQIVGGNNGWYLYRIPIRKYNSIVGDPRFSDIQYIRVWFKGGLLRASIADWRLVGSHWQRHSNVSSVSSSDSVMSVAFVNREENNGAPDYYTMPPGVTPPKQLNTSYGEDIWLNEQSIAVSVSNLRHGEERMAARFFRPLDIFYYKNLKFFVHGDGNMPDHIVQGATPKAYMFLRFGIDSSNYYEYRTPIVRGWQSKGIDLGDLTAIKQQQVELLKYQRQLFPVPGSELDSFVIKGTPTLTRVQYFGIGIYNPEQNFGGSHELSTTIWVNELRLLSPERSKDWAAVGNISIKGADLFTVNASVSTKQPNFHKLEERFGDRNSSVDWTFTAQGNIDKFLPKSFKGAKVPITYTHAENLQNPEFVANSDINLDAAVNAAINKAAEEARLAGREFTDAEAKAIEDNTRTPSQTLTVRDNWALTGVRLGLPSKSWWIRDTFNALTFNYSYSQDFERSPVVSRRFNWQWVLGAKYNVNISNFASFSPLSWAKDLPILGDYHKLKVNLLPNNFSAGVDMTRSRKTEKSRFLEFASPVIRDFSARKNAHFTWRMFENGFFNPTIDYTVNTSSTLVPYEMYLDETGTYRQRTGSEIASSILFTNGKIIDFGKNNLHNQIFNLSFRPKLPVGKYKKYIDMSGTFNTGYNWTDPLQEDETIRDVAKSAGFQNNIRFGTTIKLQSIADELWDDSSVPKPMRKPDASAQSQSIWAKIGRMMKFVFLDYEKVKIDFTQNNSAVNPGVYGETGFNNFWGFGNSSLNSGPNMAYQLGLISHPHGTFNFVGSDRFPFFSTETFPGLRPPNAVLQDNFNQRTSLSMSTSRPLWKDATLELDWKTEVGYNKNYTVETDEFGNVTFTNILANQSFDRTNLTLPTIFGINLFDNNIEHIIDLFQARKAEIQAEGLEEVKENQKLLTALSESFHDGMQAFSFFGGGDIGRFLPAVNWRINWKGIEKWGIWSGVAEKISFEHRYISTYTENAMITDNGKAIQGQQVMYGFQPLVGLTMGFDEDKLDGTLTATIRYATTSAYQLSSSNTANITRQMTDELQINASYAMHGFSFPLLGLELKNDIEFSFMTSYKANKRSSYDIVISDSGELPENDEDGQPLEGNTQLIIEPRVRYTMSNIVVASFFFRYEGTFTEGASSPGFTTTQFGLDMKINLSGGR